jgi:hypothetical protein
MTEISFSRFFKVRTGRTFIDTVNEIRLGQASRMLIDTTNNVTEIGYKCGFNNISNFNSIFKKKKIVHQKNSGRHILLMVQELLFKMQLINLGNYINFLTGNKQFVIIGERKNILAQII